MPFWCYDPVIITFKMSHATSNFFVAGKKKKSKVNETKLNPELTGGACRHQTSGALLCDYCKKKKKKERKKKKKHIFRDIFDIFFQVLSIEVVEQDEILGICGIYQTRWGRLALC